MRPTFRRRLIRLREQLPGPLASAGGMVYRAARDWRLYRDGLLFDLVDREYHTEGMTFEIPRGQTHVRHRARFHTDSHERPERSLVKRFVPPDACVLELGACFGVVSAVINRTLANPARHVAVEPNPAMLPVLERNRARNQVEFHVEHALVSERMDGTFFVDSCPTMSSANKTTSHSLRVPVVTVAALEQKYGLRFDTLVLDIQGAEDEFLHDNQDLLSRCRCVVLELHPHIIGAKRCEACRQVMRANGLSLAERDGLVEAWTRADEA